MEWLLYGALAITFILLLGAASAALMIFMGPPDLHDVPIEKKKEKK